MYDANGICWHASGSDNRCRIRHVSLDDKFLSYGRCKSGQRWFWTAYHFRIPADDHGGEAHGWESTEQAALDAALTAIVRLAGGHKAFAMFNARVAYSRLKKINAAKRAARPPSDSKDTVSSTISTAIIVTIPSGASNAIRSSRKRPRGPQGVCGSQEGARHYEQY